MQRVLAQGRPCVRVFECEVRVFECETVHVFSLSRTDLSRVTGGTLPLADHRFTTKAPSFSFPTEPVERTLSLGPSVGFQTLATLRSFWDFGEVQASVYAQRALPGRGKVAWGTRRG